MNERIRSAADAFEGTELSEWRFCCECGSPDCTVAVDLQLAQFDELVETGGHVLAAGHVVARAHHARARSRGLRGESAAVRAQAQQAVRRSDQLRREQPDQ